MTQNHRKPLPSDIEEMQNNHKVQNDHKAMQRDILEMQ